MHAASGRYRWLTTACIAAAWISRPEASVAGKLALSDDEAGMASDTSATTCQSQYAHSSAHVNGAGS